MPKLLKVAEAADAYRKATVVGLSNLSEYGAMKEALAALESDE